MPRTAAKTTKTKKITAKKSATKTTAKKTKATKTTAKKTITKTVKAAKAVKTKTVRAKKTTPVIQTAPIVVEQLAPPTNTRNIYLSNKELLLEVKKCKRKAIMSDRLAMMLQLLCAKYAKKGNFINYTYNDDMQAYAMLMLVRTWNSFNPEKSDNAFAFFTQCIKNSFIQYLNQEKRQRNIRDVLLIDQGLNPSYGFEITDEDGAEAVTLIQQVREEEGAVEQPYSSDDIEHQESAIAY